MKKNKFTTTFLIMCAQNKSKLLQYKYHELFVLLLGLFVLHIEIGKQYWTGGDKYNDH